MRLTSHVRLGLIVTLAALLGLLSGTTALIGQGSFAATGDLGTGRTGHRATLLDDGRVFVAGGFGGGSQLASTEIYDPATGTFGAGPAMSVGRVAHRAVTLADGRALIIGGFSGTAPTASVDLFDPATGTITAAAPMSSVRSDPSATVLPDGRVLVAGGSTGGAGPTDSAEIYDPATDTWTATGSLNESREAHTATLLADGTVLLTSGQATFPALRASAEIFDPATGVFSLVGSLGTARFFHTATLLADGTVLVAGGSDDFTTGVAIASVELFDPTLGVFSSPPPLTVARSLHSASLLPGGGVLFFGGSSAGGGSAEIYDLSLVTAQAAPVADPVTPLRNSHSATTLSDGSVLIAGGDDAGSTFYTAAEIYTPDPVTAPPLEPPVEPPLEPPLELPTLTFADLADTPLTGSTLVVYALSPGLSLVSLTGIIPFLAAMEAEELSAAQGEVPIELLALDLNSAPPINVSTEHVLSNATIGEIKSIFDPNTGRSFTPGAPSFVNTLDRIGPGAYWIDAGPGAFVIDLYWPGKQTVTVPGGGFYAFPYTGPAGSPGFANDVQGLASLFDWQARDRRWDSYTPGAPAFVQSLTGLGYGTGLIGRFDGPTSFMLPPAQATLGGCDVILDAGEGNDLINPSAGPGAQDALGDLNSLSGGDFAVDSFFDVFTEISIDGGCFIPSRSE